MKYSLLIIFLLVFGMSAYCQNPMLDSVQWSATGFTDNLASVSVNKACQFNSYGATGIDWIQKNGSYVTSFQVTGLQGQWTDLTTDGTVTYTVSGSGVSGTITITLASQKVTINLKVSGDSGAIDNTYTISNYTRI